MHKANYGFLVVSVFVVSVVEFVVEAEESTLEESDVPNAFLSELQAETDIDMAKAKKPNLNVFFMCLFL